MIVFYRKETSKSRCNREQGRHLELDGVTEKCKGRRARRSKY